jgi:hypothetical protein
MGGILQVDTIQNNNTSNLITQTNVTTITIGSTGQTISLASGSSSSGFGEVYNGAVYWTSTLVTSSLTVSAGVGYFVNTSTAAITLTLPSTPTFGNIVGIVDYSGYASTNNIIINPNGNKIEGSTISQLLSNNGEGVLLNYIDTTRGWIPTSGINEGTDALQPNQYSIEFLVIAGGGGGGGNASPNFACGGGGAGGYRTSTQAVEQGTVITVTVGDGGAVDAPGTNSSISGSGLTTITSAGGGDGGTGGSSGGGANGGSGGGGGGEGPGQPGGLGNTPNTSPSQGNNGGTGAAAGATGAGGGGGASGVGANNGPSSGGNGGAGTASSITGSSVTRAGGGGGGAGFSGNPGTGGTGGTGGGGNGSGTGNGTAGTTNTGGGGGGARGTFTSGAGGKGVVILSVPTAKYSSTTTGSPTVTTSGANTILQFNGSGSYTA